MSFSNNMPPQRRNPFSRTGSPAPVQANNGRPKSGLFTPHAPTSPAHSRSQSGNPLGVVLTPPVVVQARRDSKSGTPTSGTFAPAFIKTEEIKRGYDAVKGIEGENDFSGKRYVWLKDPEEAFVKGWVIEEKPGGTLLVQTDDGNVCATVCYSSLGHILTTSSNGNWILRVLTRSILRSSTRLMTWLSSHI